MDLSQVNKALKVSHFNTLLTGGAAIAARRLHDSLCNRRVDSIFYYYRGTSSHNTYLKAPFNSKTGLITKLKRKYVSLQHRQCLKGRPDWLERFSFPQTFLDSNICGLAHQPTIMHLHWIANFIDYPSFFNSIPDDIPIVWTLHDMNAFTGGCHYAWTCENFKKACGNCFQIGKMSVNDISHNILALKKRLYRGKNLHIVADSYWLEREARASSAFCSAKSFQTIHYGLDTTQFLPKNKKLCREVLRIDPDSNVLVFGASSINNSRKGLRTLLASLKHIHARKLVLLTFGRGRIDDAPDGVSIKSLGNINSSDQLAIVYSAADIFLIPSLYEAFGQTALEAMACGTPVVGFETGGIPDIVSPGETGLLAKCADSYDLARNIQYLLDHPDLMNVMGKKARLLVESKFTLEIQARQYLDLYDKLFGKHGD